MTPQIRIEWGGDYLDSRDGTLRQGDEANGAVQAWDGNRMVGSIWFEVGPDQNWIWQTWVNPEYRSTGLFQQMLTELRKEYPNTQIGGYRDRRDRTVVGSDDWQPKKSMADRTGNPQVDALIEEFLRTPMGDWTTDDTTYESLRDPQQAHGVCQSVTEHFVEFAKAKGFKAYSTDTDLDEMGYKPTGEGGEIGFNENDEMQYGFYPEHTIATIVVDDPEYPYGREYYIDFTASQYGYTDHPKVTSKTAAMGEPENKWPGVPTPEHPFQEMYHVTPVTNRNSIQTGGLTARENYMWPTIQHARIHAGNRLDSHDIWAVDVRGLPLALDPENWQGDPQYYNAHDWEYPDEGFYANGPIDPSRLRLHGQPGARVEAMAADPAFLEQWIAEHGPYAYHGVRSGVVGMSDEQAIASIQQQGIIPDQRPTPEQRPTYEQYGLTGPDDYHNAELQSQVNEYDNAHHEWWLSPRPGHVFMTLDPQDAYGPLVAKIDLRKLDPAKIKPDDDDWRDNVAEDTGENTLGEHMNQIGWGDNPEDTHQGFEHGVLAYEGGIPPQAIEGFYNSTSAWQGDAQGRQTMQTTLAPWAHKAAVGAYYHVSADGGHEQTGFDGRGCFLFDSVDEAISFGNGWLEKQPNKFLYAISGIDPSLLRQDDEWEAIEEEPNEHAFVYQGEIPAQNVRLLDSKMNYAHWEREDFNRLSKTAAANWIETPTTEEHQFMKQRVPWVYDTATQTLHIGSPGSDHGGVLNTADIWHSYEDSWQGVWIADKNTVVIHSHYDVDTFRPEQIDQGLINQLKSAFRGAQITYQNDYGDGYSTRLAMGQNGELPEGIAYEITPFSGGYLKIAAKLGQTTIGQLIIHRFSNGSQRISDIWVTPSYRRLGVASGILAYAQQQLGPISHSNTLTEEGAAWEASDPRFKQAATPQFMYHISGPNNRDSILQHGLNWELADPATLLPNDDSAGPGWADNIWPRGQYLFRDYEEASNYGEDDLWQVDVTGLHIEPDPYLGLENDHAALVREPIGPERLKLVHKAGEPTENWDRTSKTAAGTVMYHVAPASQRASIQAHGLDQAQSTASPWSNKGVDYEPGQYLWVNAELAEEYVHTVGREPDEYDIWAVNTQGLKLMPDPEATPDNIPNEFLNEEAEYQAALVNPLAWYTTEPIGPERLHLEETVPAQEWEDRYGHTAALPERIPMAEKYYEPDDSQGNNWVYLNGKVAFGTHHHRLIHDLAKQLGLDNFRAQQLANSLVTYQQPTGIDCAIGNMHGNYPQIWVSTVDRNHVYDSVLAAQPTRLH